MEKITGSTFVDVRQLPEIFNGLKFNLDKMRVVMPDGRLLNRARFDVMFGGYTYALDDLNERTTRSAWRAFTANNVYRPLIV